MVTVRPLRPSPLGLLVELASARLWGTNQQGGQDLFSYPSSNGLSYLSRQASHNTKKRGHNHHSGGSALSCPPTLHRTKLQTSAAVVAVSSLLQCAL